MTHPYTIPNLLTALRIASIPAIVVLFYLPYTWSDMACGLMFALAGITDSIDGYLARRLGQVSPLGAFLDPVADKVGRAGGRWTGWPPASSQAWPGAWRSCA